MNPNLELKDGKVVFQSDTPPKPEGMSKNAWKKQLKEMKYFSKKEAIKNSRKLKRVEKKKGKSTSKRKIALKEENGYKVLLDMSFENYMSEKEFKSATAQIVFSYASARGNGLSLIISSVTPKVEDSLSKIATDHNNWKCSFINAHFSDANTSELGLVKDAIPNFCYLTADSENEIEHLDPNTIYVVGGIVDRNRHKNLCLNEANRLNIAHARLPIGKYVKLATRKVLTINQVIGILGEYSNSGDWEKSFLNVIPMRKGVTSINHLQAEKTLEISDIETRRKDGWKCNLQ
jgi:tRNA (guanine9-N1)-methyltransferase